MEGTSAGPLLPSACTGSAPPLPRSLHALNALFAGVQGAQLRPGPLSPRRRARCPASRPAPAARHCRRHDALRQHAAGVPPDRPARRAAHPSPRHLPSRLQITSSLLAAETTQQQVTAFHGREACPPPAPQKELRLRSRGRGRPPTSRFAATPLGTGLPAFLSRAWGGLSLRLRRQRQRCGSPQATPGLVRLQS